MPKSNEEPRVLICANCMDECRPFLTDKGYVSECCGFGIIYEPEYVSQDKLAEYAASLADHEPCGGED